MNYFLSALRWLADSANWRGPSGIGARLLEHVILTLGVVGIAAAIALPIGIVVGHTRRGAGFVGAVVGSARSIPTLGLLTIFGLIFGIGLDAPIIALVILAIPSLLAGAYSGIQAIDPAVPAAATAIGMSPAQVVFRVELPLALPVIVGGLRATVLQVVSTATLAAYVADWGLGRFLFAGLRSHNYPLMLGGSLAVIALAIVCELLLSALQRATARRAAPARLLQRQRPHLPAALGQRRQSCGIERHAGQIKHRRTHVHAHAAIRLLGQFDHAVFHFHAHRVAGRQPLPAHVAHKAARAVAAVLHFMAIVVDDVFEIHIRRGRGPHAQNLVGPHAKVAVGQKTVLIRRQVQRRGRFVKHHEIVARPLHFGKAHSHGGGLSGAPGRRIPLAAAPLRPARQMRFAPESIAACASFTRACGPGACS